MQPNAFIASFFFSFFSVPVHIVFEPHIDPACRLVNNTAVPLPCRRYMSSIFPLLYLLFCDEMCMRFRSLRTRWRTEVTKVLASTPRATCQALESERLAHAQLCDLVEEIRVAFGPRLTTYLLFVFLEHLARFYFDTYVMPTYRNKHSDLEIKGVSPLESLMFLAHAWIGTYLVAYLSDTLTESVMIIHNIWKIKTIPSTI